MWRRFVVSAARRAGEGRDVAAGTVTVEVQGDLTPVADVVDPVRADPDVDQDRSCRPEKRSDRDRLWGAVLADRSDPDDLFLAQPRPHSTGESRNHFGSETLVALADERRISIAGGGDDYDPVQPDLAERGQTIDEIGRITHQREAL